MNHDATHCLDYKKSCPKSCYRAQLTEEIRRCSKSIPLGLFNMISWSHFKGTKECPYFKKKPSCLIELLADAHELVQELDHQLNLKKKEKQYEL